MKCKDCINFRQSSRMESGREISPGIKSEKGTCSINNARCKAEDECRYGGFSQK
ncbi:MAG: hypothetical protein HPY74_02935 [Firmicutes bacterium]|nr:hypothetical protein [Bacillota bacterium]